MKPDLPFCKEKKENEKSSTAIAITVAVATALTRRRQDSGKRTVFIQAVQKRDENGQAATAKYVRAEHSVFRAKHD